MEFDKTFFPHFPQFCIDKLGQEVGKLISMEAEDSLYHMKKEADDKNNKSIRWHMDKSILPAIAIYLAFKKFDMTSDKAYELTDEVMQIARLKSKKKNEFIGRLPLGYFLFKLFCKSVVTKQYPEQGWDIQWFRNDKKEIHFNMKSCIYFDTTKKYDCTEMCPLFCANDDVNFSGYMPAIVFERSGTLALGQELCDFHFKNGKYIKQE